MFHTKREEENKSFLDWVREFSSVAALSFSQLEVGDKFPLKHPKNSVSALIDVAVNVFFQSPVSAYILRCDPNFQILYDAIHICVENADEKAFENIAQAWIKHTVGLALHLMFNENGYLQNPMKMEFQIHQFSFEEAAKQLKQLGASKESESIYLDLLYRKLIGAFLFSLTQGLLLKKLLTQGKSDANKARYTEYVNRLRRQQKIFLGVADARDIDLKDDLNPGIKKLLKETALERQKIASLFGIEDNPYHQHARAMAVQVQLEVEKMQNELTGVYKRIIQGNVNRCLGEIAQFSQQPFEKKQGNLETILVRGKSFQFSSETVKLLAAMQIEIHAINCMDRLALFDESLQNIQERGGLASCSLLERTCLFKIKETVVIIQCELGGISVQSPEKKKEEHSKRLLQTARDDMALCLQSAAAVRGHRHHHLMSDGPSRTQKRRVISEQEKNPSMPPGLTHSFGN